MSEAEARELHSQVTGPGLLRTIRRDRRQLVPIAGAFIAVAVVFAIIVPSNFESEAVLLPSSGQGDVSRLGSLAASVGLNVGASSAGSLSPELFQTLVKSDYLLGQLLERSYPVRSEDGRPIPLSTVVDGNNVDERIEKLGEALSVSYDRIVGLLRVSFSSRDPLLSKSVLDTAVVILERWTADIRRQDAIRMRDFVAARIDSIRLELDGRRSALEGFRMQNRSASGQASPPIARQLAELQLEVTLREAAYTTLVQQLELAEMDAARDMPLLRVLDPPRELTGASGPNRKIIVALGVMGAFGVLVVGAWLRT